MSVNIVAVLQSSVVMVVLLILSIVSLAIVIERMVVLMRSSVNAPKVTEKVVDIIANNGTDAAMKYCARYPKVPLMRVLKVLLGNAALSRENINEMVNIASAEEEAKLKISLSFLATLGKASPLLGLLGTTIGLVRAFRDLALAGSAGPSVVAAGISEALYTTVAGIIIAVPIMIAHTLLLNKTRGIIFDIHTSCRKVMVAIGKSTHQEIGA